MRGNEEKVRRPKGMIAADTINHQIIKVLGIKAPSDWTSVDITLNRARMPEITVRGGMTHSEIIESLPGLNLIVNEGADE